jgi:glycolate oxidase
MNNIPDGFIDLLRSYCGKEWVFTDAASLNEYGRDHTEDFVFPPQIVVKPADKNQVRDVVLLCNAHGVPVTPVAARTGLSGGALSVKGGVALSMERMNRILDIDLNNLQVTVEPGVITQHLQEAVAAHGLYYPPDPASRGSCTIGGNLAENSGGPRALKYGVTKDYVLNLEVVLADGTVIWTGANTLKNSTGYNLTQLIVGSEGTLGVITKAVLKLIPHPTVQMLLLVPFESSVKACEAVSAVFRAGVTPGALEFMERDALEFVFEHYSDLTLDLPQNATAFLLIESDGNDSEAVMKSVEQIYSVMNQYGSGEILFADTDAQKERIWKVRRRIGEAVKAFTVFKEEDTVVPRFYLPQLLDGVKKLGQEYGFRSVCFGHAGDGNLHINILKGSMSDYDWKNILPQAITRLFQLTISLGGTLSGEHGIGWVQKDYMPLAFSDHHLALMKQIKHVFDPKGILNPGKIFPDER